MILIGFVQKRDLDLIAIGIGLSLQRLEVFATHLLMRMAVVRVVFEQDVTGCHEGQDAIDVAVRDSFVFVAWQPDDFARADGVKQRLFHVCFCHASVTIGVEKACLCCDDRTAPVTDQTASFAG